MDKANILHNRNLGNTYHNYCADFEVAAQRELLLQCLVGGKEQPSITILQYLPH